MLSIRVEVIMVFTHAYTSATCKIRIFMSEQLEHTQLHHAFCNVSAPEDLLQPYIARHSRQYKTDNVQTLYKTD